MPQVLLESEARHYPPEFRLHVQVFEPQALSVPTTTAGAPTDHRPHGDQAVLQAGSLVIRRLTIIARRRPPGWCICGP